ncbi:MULTISPECIES: BREX-1 system phosphatase PglZ type A [unclassified Adlercreutzia]|uniref:BREX-1 system phosphatase PglZ type A n=1 Tax=unclassified Adlercreutzia TaxID=2636013 RepID=UPI0013ED63D1|nr:MULTISPECIES: BREX-1 system phosphatase PglZ type A [unclassified Adlercreutzia]
MHIDVEDQLARRFAAPLPDCARRRIVIWHDAEGEFADVFAKLEAAGFGGADAPPLPRLVRLVRAEPGGLFAVKKLLARDDVESDVLVYRRRARGSLEGDWLADVELYAESFQADYLSLLVDQLDAADTDEVRAALSELKGFFAAKDRAARFKSRVGAPRTSAEVRCGVLAVLLGSAEVSPEAIVRALLLRLRAGEGALCGVEKFGARAALERLVEHVTGYAGDVADSRSLSAHVLVTASSATMDPAHLKGLERYLAPACAQFCLNVVRGWMSCDDEAAYAALYEACREVEDACNLPRRFAELPLAALGRCEVFPCVNERILQDLMGSLAQGAHRCEEVGPVVQARRCLGWYECVEPYFDLLSAAADMQAFYLRHTQGFHLARAHEAWRAYVEDWHAMDTAYRRLVCALNRSAKDPSPLLEEEASALADWADRLYNGWFLPESTACWTRAALSQWAVRGCVEDVPDQRRFFADVVEPELSAGHRVCAIVSDALRFEVACELADRLERQMRGQARLDTMQAAFPSVTEFGMAALLPHAALAFDAGARSVLADGLPTGTTEQRQAVLRGRVPQACALRAPDVLGMKTADLKQATAQARVVYVYHNKIDAAGEKLPTEGEVFEACADAIEDVCALAKRAVSGMGITRVVVTADHGFLFTRKPLRAFERVGRDVLEGESVLEGRRFAVARDGATSDVLARVDMSAYGPFAGFAPRDCTRIKRPGAGERYVHGGASLQELCVPVIRFRSLRAGAKGAQETRPTTLQLVSTNRRITSALFRVELFQTEAVAGKVAPRAYDLVLTDASGNEVSDVRLVHADSASASELERVTQVAFALSAKRAFAPAEPCYLVAREHEGGRVAWKEEFSVDIAFMPLDDFGF